MMSDREEVNMASDTIMETKWSRIRSAEKLQTVETENINLRRTIVG